MKTLSLAVMVDNNPPSFIIDLDPRQTALQLIYGAKPSGLYREAISLARTEDRGDELLISLKELAHRDRPQSVRLFGELATQLLFLL